MIERYSNEGIQTNLAISLHAPNDEIRDQLMPVNKAFNMDALRKSVADYITKDNDHDGIGVFLQEHLISRS